MTLALIRGFDGKAVSERQARRLFQPYLDKVVDFDAACDVGFADRGAIDARVGLDFHGVAGSFVVPRTLLRTSFSP